MKTRLTLTAASVLLLAGAAHAQTALGGGRALDGGLSNTAGGRVNASAQDLQAIVKYGVYDTYRGNALNGPGAAYGARSGSTSYRSLSPAFNEAASRGLIRDPALLNRYGSSTNFSDSFAYSNRIDRVAALEAGRLPNGALTSSVSLPQGTSAGDFARKNDPYVGFVYNEQGSVMFAKGSALRGLVLEPSNRVDLSAASRPGEKRSGTAETYGLVMDELRRASMARAINPNRVDSTLPLPGAAKPAGKPAPGSVAVDPAAKPAGPAPLQFDPDSTVKRLRERLANAAAAEKKAAPKPVERAGRETDATIPTTPDPSNAGASQISSEEDINTLRTMGLKLDSYVPAGATDSQAADGYTRLGQEALTKEKFGLADQMFESALTRSPGNPLAQAGKIHATLGLGLLMSGGTNLRTYMVEHPEMIPVRFDTTLLMPKTRADHIAGLLTTDLERVDGPLLPDAGLTLAYLGRQYDNQLWLAKGLDAMGTQTKSDPQGQQLREILIKVWLNPAKPAAPAPEPEK